MTSLRVTAELGGPVHFPSGSLALDSLLMAARALRDGLPPALTADELQTIDVPIAVDPLWGIRLASVGQFEVEAEELRYTNRRPPIEQFQSLGGPEIKRIAITMGVNKGYRIPRPVSYLRDDLITWWCEGDEVEIRELLELVTHVGKKRSVGWGKVMRWTVEECETWPGFPVVRDGRPLRPLPVDWPGLVDPPLAYRVLTAPYWDQSREELCAVP